MKNKTQERSVLAAGVAGVALIISASVGLGGSSQTVVPPYSALVEADGALGYYRFSDSLQRGNSNANSTSLGAAGNVTNTTATATTDAVRAFPGALAGDGNRSQFYDSVAWGMIPYNAALNPDNTRPFTVEAWFYPASDQINGGQCPINNRLAGSAPNRTGWVFFQRAPDASYTGKSGFEGVGWDCRMYRGSGSSSGLDVVSQVPYDVGKWTHVAVVYDPVDPVTNASLIIYINGIPANTNVWTGGTSGTDPGYVANASDSDVALSLGAYNNTSGAGGNSYFGGIDEVAFYAARLTDAQILAHYQNGTNAHRSAPYAALIQSDNPSVYLRLDELSPGADTVLNLGDSRVTGNGTNSPAIKHPGTSALAGRSDDGSLSGHYQDVGASGHTFASIPWNAGNNPPASVPFSLEAWFRPTGDQMNPGPSPINNRLANGVADRTGWVIYQRDPNDSYKGPPAVSGESGLGWTFRPYTGNGSGSGGDLQLAAPYNLGQWLHFVVTWEPQSVVGTFGSGSEEWSGILTGYINGVPVATNAAANYAANVSPTADAREPGDLAIGSYNLASGLGEEFAGDIDEVAVYNNYVLTTNQILAHYMTGTNSHPATNYETLVLTAAYDGQPATPQRTGPKTYLRFNEPAFFPASNSGSLGYLADGSLVLTSNNGTGPTGVGFGATNASVQLNGTNAWLSLNDPSGMNISGQVTLEAWILPDAVQGDPARIVSHGPPTATVYDLNTYPLTLSGSQLSSNEVYLRIEGGGANYSVGTSDGTTVHGVTAPVTSGDLGGTNGWVYLVGTYDGANWSLFRNGVQIATAPDTVGALPVTGGEWAVGTTGLGWAGFYSGGVAQVAVYGTALSAAKVNAHYSIAKNGLITLTISQTGGKVTVQWPAGTLQQSATVDGTYTDVPGATAPSYAPPVGAATKFYRVKL